MSAYLHQQGRVFLAVHLGCVTESPSERSPRKGGPLRLPDYGKAPNPYVELAHACGAMAMMLCHDEGRDHLDGTLDQA
jgi:hypothetical protein